MKIDKNEHYKQTWRAHSLLNDFKVEDVWLLPIILEQNHDLDTVLTQFVKLHKCISETGLTGKLFQFRYFLGKLFNWDDIENGKGEIIAGKIGVRYVNTESLSLDDLPKGKPGPFVPVFYLENEYLLELQNHILQAAIHLGKIPLKNNKYKVHMAVYVKPHGIFGHLYMLAIKPFRLLIVYPIMMKKLNLLWKNFIQLESKVAIESTTN